MPIVVLADTMSLDFGDVLFLINGLALTLLFGILYVDEILAAANRALRALNPLTLPARLRTWRAAHRFPS